MAVEEDFERFIGVVPLVEVRAAVQTVLDANYARVLDDRRIAELVEAIMQRLGASE